MNLDLVILSPSSIFEDNKQVLQQRWGLVSFSELFFSVTELPSSLAENYVLNRSLLLDNFLLPQLSFLKKEEKD